MNTLSLAIYGIELLNNIQVFLIFSIAFCVGWFFVNALIYTMISDNYHYDGEALKSKIKHMKKAVTAAFVIGFILVFVPSQKTVILIAASEIGQMAIESENGVDITNELTGIASDSTKLLRVYIQKEIENFNAVDTAKKAVD